MTQASSERSEIVTGKHGKRLALPMVFLRLLYLGIELFLGHQRGVVLLLYETGHILAKLFHQRLAVSDGTNVLLKLSVHCVELYSCHRYLVIKSHHQP